MKSNKHRPQPTSPANSAVESDKNNKRVNSTIGFRPNPEAKAYLDAVIGLRADSEKSDIVNVALCIAAQHASPAELLRLLDIRAREAEVARLEEALAAARAALATTSGTASAPKGGPV